MQDRNQRVVAVVDVVDLPKQATAQMMTPAATTPPMMKGLNGMAAAATGPAAGPGAGASGGGGAASGAGAGVVAPPDVAPPEVAPPDVLAPPLSCATRNG